MSCKNIWCVLSSLSSPLSLSHFPLDKFFASASLDGCLVVWHTDNFTPRVLAFPENYKSSEKIFIYSVHYLLPLGEVCQAMNFPSPFLSFSPIARSYASLFRDI
jgi:hypothetical protein